MLGIFVTSIISFVSTNIDNIFVIMLLYAQVNEKLKTKHIVIGQYLGLAVLVAISILGAFGLTFFPQKYIGLLGLFPIALGITEWVKYKEKNYISDTQCDESNMKAVKSEAGITADHAEETKNEQIEHLSSHPANENRKLQHVRKKAKSVIANAISPEILRVVIVAVANGADNIGVYIPLFTGYSTMQLFLTVIVFTLMMAIWCLLGNTITNFPKVTTAIQTYKHVAVPIIFIGLGIFIFIKTGLFG